MGSSSPTDVCEKRVLKQIYSESGAQLVSGVGQLEVVFPIFINREWVRLIKNDLNL